MLPWGRQHFLYKNVLKIICFTNWGSSAETHKGGASFVFHYMLSAGFLKYFILILKKIIFISNKS